MSIVEIIVVAASISKLATEVLSTVIEVVTGVVTVANTVTSFVTGSVTVAVTGVTVVTGAVTVIVAELVRVGRERHEQASEIADEANALRNDGIGIARSSSATSRRAGGSV